MAKKHSLVIVDKNDPKLKLGQLDGKFCERISLNSSNHSKKPRSRLERIIRKLMNKNDPYLAVYFKAKEKNANVAVIEEKTGNFFINPSSYPKGHKGKSQIKEKNEYSITASLYSIPGINLYHPAQLFEGGFGMNLTNSEYALAKSFEYSSSK